MAQGVDEQFANDIRAALDQGGRTNLLPALVVVAAMIGGFIVWAQWATLEEVTTGLGRIVPTSQMQLIQPFEAGVVVQINAAEGDIVDAGQVLLRLDDTDARSALGELQQRQLVLEAKRARLQAEAQGDQPVFSPETPMDILLGEQQLYNARQLALAQERAVIDEQLAQRNLERTELELRIEETAVAIELLDREVELARRLFDRRAIPEIDFLQRERAALAEQQELSVLRAQLPRTAAAIAEAEAQLANLDAQFASQARGELAQAIGDVAVIRQSILSAQQRLERTTLSSPVRGVVNALPVTTIGAVIRPGENVVEIVPLDEQLFVEAEIRPQDIAFISAGQDVSVKVTAYDYTVYGDLPGVVRRISADTFEDEQGESFYRVTVEIEDNSIGSETDPLPLIPGMVVTADVLTGQKTVMQYLLNPITRARNEALRER
ncbi:HlyD family type I secretion periplasmic adaptor subunit [Ahrensia marina]|uniref:HlyD family type I secretion periplasmic adaptor subunit n=1 Tax=Ahrensia marina TaxID=1514904 RepID=UPI0035D05163